MRFCEVVILARDPSYYFWGSWSHKIALGRWWSVSGDVIPHLSNVAHFLLSRPPFGTNGHLKVNKKMFQEVISLNELESASTLFLVLALMSIRRKAGGRRNGHNWRSATGHGTPEAPWVPHAGARRGVGVGKGVIGGKLRKLPPETLHQR